MDDSDKHVELRRNLGQFATGVTVITCTDHLGTPCGITANSFAAVSLEPPLVLWSIAKTCNSLGAYLEAEHFAIHVLTAAQQDLSEHFARSDHTRFDQVEFALSDLGVPLLPGVLARFDCRRFRIHDGGDHHIIVGEVLAHLAVPGEPLVFCQGSYGTASLGPVRGR